MKKILIYENGAFTIAYSQLKSKMIPGSDLDKWLIFQITTGVKSIWLYN